MLLFFFFSLLYKQEIQRYVDLYRRRVSAVRGNVCACLREQLARGLEKKGNILRPLSFLIRSSPCHSLSLPSLQGFLNLFSSS